MLNDESIVKPKLGLIVGIILTFTGWGIVIFLGCSLVSDHSPFPSYINRSYEIILTGFLLFFGPISVLLSSWEIKYDGVVIKFTKFFRVVKKTFYVNDIRSLCLIPATKHKSARIKLVLGDGYRINVSRVDYGFTNFWIFLRGDENELRGKK
jgi:hypothetical protein